MPTTKLPSLQRLAALKNPGNLALAPKASTLTVTALYFQDLKIILTDARATFGKLGRPAQKVENTSV